MDIISHTLTGIAVGTVFAPISNGNWKQKSSIILIGGLGGALPDFDAISLWSKFDTTIGSFLGLENTGHQIYFGKFWYSHHAAFHSLLAPLILVFISLLFSSLVRKQHLFDIANQFSKKRFAISAFVIGFLFHLFEDMPTPSSVWGGVNLFFPSDNYIGGFGNIWWWNNYDLVLIIVSVLSVNLIINVIPRLHGKIKIKASISVFVFGLVLGIIQIKTRPTDFSYSGHNVDFQKLEKESKLIQKEILGESLFHIMEYIDNKIPLNF